MNWIAFAVGSTLCASLLVGTVAVAGRDWLKARLAEANSQVGIASALMATATIASLPSSYDMGNGSIWLGLIPAWTGAFILVCMPAARGVVPAILTEDIPKPIPAADAAITAQEGQ